MTDLTWPPRILDNLVKTGLITMDQFLQAVKNLEAE